MRYPLSRFVPPGSSYHIARVEYRRGDACELHTHDFAELFVIEAGRGVHLINGRRIALAAGDLVLIRPDDCHGFRSPRGGGFTMLNIAFERKVIHHLRDRYFDGAADWPGGGAAMPATWPLDTTQLRQVTALSTRLSQHNQRLIDLESFLIDVLRLVTARQTIGHAQPQWLCDAINRFTEADDLSGGVGALVELTGRSIEHVNRTVRQTLSQTTTELVNTIRLDRASHLLRMTGRPIVEVAFDCGFENLGYFYRRFKQRFGQTPRLCRLAAQAVARGALGAARVAPSRKRPAVTPAPFPFPGTGSTPTHAARRLGHPARRSACDRH